MGNNCHSAHSFQAVLSRCTSNEGHFIFRQWINNMVCPVHRYHLCCSLHWLTHSWPETIWIHSLLLLSASVGEAVKLSVHSGLFTSCYMIIRAQRCLVIKCSSSEIPDVVRIHPARKMTPRNKNRRPVKKNRQPLPVSATYLESPCCPPARPWTSWNYELFLLLVVVAQVLLLDCIFAVCVLLWAMDP